MLVMRPAQMADLGEVQRLAADSPIGVTSLPDDVERLSDKIAASEASFAAEVSFNGEESYFFVLEDTATGAASGVVDDVGAAVVHALRGGLALGRVTEAGEVRRLRQVGGLHGRVGLDLLDAGDEAGLELLDQRALRATDEADVVGRALRRGGDAGEGRWTVEEAIDRAVPMPAISAALFARFSSRQDDSPAMKLIAAMRNQFGGHAIHNS